MIIPSPLRRPAMAALAAAAAIWGSFAAWHYHALGLTLSHYDARGHLVVARRIFDSITPGWQQIGAVWLPLPHLLNALPVQVDFFYRTGASGVAISIASFVVTVVSIAWIVETLTGSLAAGAAAAAVFAANPSVLYLQATPMTEPLLLGTTTFAVALLIENARQEGATFGSMATAGGTTAGLKPCSTISGTTISGTTAGLKPCSTFAVGLALALACLTRYEAWTVTAAALACAAWAIWRTNRRMGDAIMHVARIAAWPAAAIALFMIFSRVVVGEWFVSDGFFTPENVALGHPIEAAKQIVWGVRELSGYGLVAAAGLGLVVLLVAGVLDRTRGALLIAASFLATAAVPWYAFLKGHPYRIRYMVPLMAAQAIAAGVAAGYVKRARPFAVAALLLLGAFELRPFDMRAPMVVEAQWDRPNVVARQPVSDFLRANYDGTTIMASMGSLGHYMQDLSREHFDIRDFLQEGNGDIWLNALDTPRPFAGWILIEEKAEGGDMLAEQAREHPGFLAGYSRVSEGAGLALYRRTSPPAAIGSAAQNFRLNVTR